MNTLGGAMAKKIQNIRQPLVELSAKLFAFIDYPDDEIEDTEYEEIRAAINRAINDSKKIMDTYSYGRYVRSGVKTVIAGTPNVGKSSLLNALAGYERSIVTDISGTTRDVVEETVVFGGMKLVLTDTAGIRETDDVVESIGVKKSYEQLEQADLIISVFDGSREMNAEDVEIAEKIKSAITEYAQLSQAKDRSFPVRAIKNRKALTIEQIKERMIELEKKRKELVANGFLEETENITTQELIESITEDSKKILTVYVADTEEKLNTFSKISALINMFKDLLSSNFAHKEIVFDQNQGFYFSPTYSSETKIFPTNLSSGEQQEIVMFYDLIFNTSADTLVLVDEPELSLHIKWQLEYVDEMLKIINANDFYTLIATHSPQIINDKWDYTISLGEQN